MENQSATTQTDATAAPAYDLDAARDAVQPFSLLWFAQLPSTNDYAVKRLSGGHLAPPAIVLTGLQTAGRGQRGNRWWSSDGCLTASFVIPARNDLVPSLMPILRGYVRSLRPDAVWLFTNRRGGRLHEEHLSAELLKVQREHNLPWRCNHFRHTFASHLAQRGVSLFKIAALMGNGEQICAKHYAHLSAESLAIDVEFRRPKKSDADSQEPLARRIHLPSS